MDENMSNALLMAAAVLIFIIALTTGYSLISQVKETSDYVLDTYDETKYYSEGYEDIIYKSASVDGEGRAVTDRIVNFDTVLPTIYRYIKEHYGVTIIEKDGTIVARFDETTESIVNNWPSWKKSSPGKCEVHFNKLKDRITSVGLNFKYNDYTKLDVELWEKIYGITDRTTGDASIKYGTPWLGDEGRVASRLDVDVNGGSAQFSTGKHPGVNLMEKYSKNSFKEYFVFVSDDDDAVYTGENDDSVVLRSTTTKLEIIYLVMD